MNRWRGGVGNSVALLVLILGAWVAPAGGADFDDDSHADLAVGVPFENVGALADAGALNVLYGTGSGLTATRDQLWVQDDLSADISEELDLFGDALAAGDFDGDGAIDLAVGVPWEDIGTAIYGGAVHVLYGLRGVGLTETGNQLWHQDSPGIGGAAETDDEFGTSLAVGDFDGDGYDDLAVGAMREDIGLANDAGAVNVIYGGSGGLASIDDQVWWEGENGLGGTPEAVDWFGFALVGGDFDGDGYDDLAVGIPREDVAGVMESGEVVILYGTSQGLSAADSQAWAQGRDGVPDAPEEQDFFGWELGSGDFNGDGFADLGIGAPSENLVGAVVALYGSVDGLTGTGTGIWAQVESEEGCQFGSSLVAGDLDGDGHDELVVGIPWEDLGSILDAGAVEILHGGPGGLFRPLIFDIWHQDVSGVLDAAEAYDEFGSALAAGDFNHDTYVDLAVGVPREDTLGVVDAGVVQVLYGSVNGVTAAGNQLWHQNSPGIDGSAEYDDRFGEALVAVPRGRQIFADGFETGDTSAWSTTVP